MKMRTLTTTRLFLRPATEADLDSLWEIWRDPEVRRYLFDDIPVSRERACEVLMDSLAMAERGLGLWSVRLANTPQIMGCAGLMEAGAAAEYDPRLRGAVEPLAAFAPRVWHRGYAQEALEALIAYAFSSLGLSRLAAVNDVPNEASDRLVRRLGFELTGECEGPRYRLRTYALERERRRSSATS
jgi:ribosomal-protein-alanine N-acetyltransferase